VLENLYSSAYQKTVVCVTETTLMTKQVHSFIH